EIQHLEFVRHFTRVLHPLPDPGDHFLQQGNENVRFRNREGLPEHRGHFPPRGWCAIPNGMLAWRPPETPAHPSSAAAGPPYHPAPQDLMARSGVLPPAPDLRRTAHGPYGPTLRRPPGIAAARLRTRRRHELRRQRNRRAAAPRSA